MNDIDFTQELMGFYEDESFEDVFYDTCQWPTTPAIPGVANLFSAVKIGSSVRGIDADRLQTFIGDALSNISERANQIIILVEFSGADLFDAKVIGERAAITPMHAADCPCLAQAIEHYRHTLPGLILSATSCGSFTFTALPVERQ